MDAELKRRVDALRRPLELAAADGFSGVRKVQGLGNALRAACDGVLARHASDPIAGLDTWRLTLGRWEQLDEQQQAIEVARGMRLLARLPRTSSVMPQRMAPTFALPPLPASPPPPITRLPVTPPPRAASAAPSARPTTGTPMTTANTVVRSTARVNAAAPRTAAVNTTSPDATSTTRAAATAAAPRAAGKAAAGEATDAAPRTAAANTASPDATSTTRAASMAAAQRAAGKAAAGEATAAAPRAGKAAAGEATAAAQRAAGKAAAGEATAAAPRAGKAAAGEATTAAQRAAGKAAAGEATAAALRAAAIRSVASDTAIADLQAAPTSSLPGIGPALADRLAERGLTTVEDLLWLVPRRYDDVRDARSLAEVCELPEGQRATFAARVASARMVFARGRRWAEVRLGSVDVTTPATALVRWFNVFAGIDRRMPAGCQVVLSGIVRKRAGRLELANPDILGIEIDNGQGSLDGAKKPLPSILARYPDVPGVPPGRLRAACAAACARAAGAAEDGVPAGVESAAGLPSLAETLAQLHAPSATTAAADIAAMNRGDSRWQRRLAFGELFALGVAITLRRRDRCSDAAVPCPRAPEPSDLERRLARALPFALTGAQRRAIDEIGDDLARETPMNRLLQGDVGAGKTCVAFAAALQAAAAGRQTAVMAPTELLAEQHAETWRGWATSSGLRLELLTASTPRGIRASLLALLAAGELDVVIGTHALIAESVGFRALGLVVIDEQHRFGVAQRARLRDKGDGQGAPHLLVMTATPIPRTLALTAYGDLDVSVLDELPPGRKPVTTRVLSGARGTAAAYKLVAERVRAGERAYIVCPKVEPGEPDGDDDDRAWKDATTVATEVSAALPAVRTGLVHGRLDSVARDRAMRAFKAGELDVLVATTVIEVGVDVPAATVMVIHDAERFGLAQLHQLRGRVGRGGGSAHCLLLSQGANGEDARRRLDAMVATHDGFRIAEEDLALRGPGELLGPKQAGVPRLRFGDLAQHTELLLEARRHAEAVLAEDPQLARPAHAALRRALERRLVQTVYGAESG